MTTRLKSYQVSVRSLSAAAIYLDFHASKSHWVIAWLLQRQLQRPEWFFCVVKSHLRLTLTTRKLYERQWNILVMMIHQRVSFTAHFNSLGRGEIYFKQGYVSIVTGLHGWQSWGFWFMAGVEIFLFFTVLRLALGPTQPTASGYWK